MCTFCDVENKRQMTWWEATMKRWSLNMTWRNDGDWRLLKAWYKWQLWFKYLDICKIKPLVPWYSVTGKGLLPSSESFSNEGRPCLRKVRSQDCGLRLQPLSTLHGFLDCEPRASLSHHITSQYLQLCVSPGLSYTYSQPTGVTIRYYCHHDEQRWALDTY